MMNSPNPNWDEPHGEQGPGYRLQRSLKPDAKIPPQVDVAFDVVRWANSIEDGNEGRELYAKEIAVYEAALEVLRLYLSGEMSFTQGLYDPPDVCGEEDHGPPGPRVDVKTSP